MKYFVGVPDALFFVGVGWPDPSDPGRQLAYLLFVDPADVDSIVPFHFHGHSFFGLNVHGVAVANAKCDSYTSFGNPVAYTHDHQSSRETFGYAGYGIGDQASSEAVQRVVEFVV